MFMFHDLLFLSNRLIKSGFFVLDKALVGWLIDSLRPGKQFFSHVGTEPPLPGYYQYFLGSKCALLKDTTRFDTSGARTPDL